ncbi:MAG: right-handed parallel beta-helix repeat-containing protein [Candidatus Thermoplasmatota archaeon]|nr:right-handed parallel beta-helix repeat-containing protein [Candidatus Thermoplasmatota archaeon]
MELQYSSNNIITGCKLYNNTHMGIDAIAESNDKNTISNCAIYNNKVNGIYLSSSSDNQIMDCSISNNKDGNVITTGNSYNNEIANTNFYTSETKTTEDNSISYQNNKITPEKDTKNSVLNAISNIKINNYNIIVLFTYIAMFFANRCQ